ncbi:TrkA C-terminal domain-containing protein [Nocardioides sp. GY 10127]|uniref:cation:proton antiporter regulatory subunit n=1 Tax=Nocardioides sp. GY 10127 TaxID=2569762 RepID=UPI003211EBA0
MAEIQVGEASDMVGRSLGESGLRERDITALTLHKGTQVIPNPNAHHVLEAGDRLLCFGKLEEMRSMIPRRKRRQKLKKLPAEPIHEPAEAPTHPSQGTTPVYGGDAGGS